MEKVSGEEKYIITSPVLTNKKTARLLLENGNTLNSAIERIDLPDLNGEILYFRDTSHLRIFYYQLNDLIELPRYKNTDIDSILNKVESFFSGLHHTEDILIKNFRVLVI